METETSTWPDRSAAPRFTIFVPEGPHLTALVGALAAGLRGLRGGPWQVTIREHATEGLAVGHAPAVWSVEISARGTCAMTLVRPAMETPQAVVQRIRGILGD